MLTATPILGDPLYSFVCSGAGHTTKSKRMPFAHGIFHN
jgi:hypothetical protein